MKRTSIIAVAFLCSLSIANGQDRQARDDAKASIVGYASNVQSFPFYRVKYKTTKASAATVDDALKGKWQNAVSVDTLYIIDGENEVLIRDAGPMPAPPKPPNKATGPQYVPGGAFSSEQLLIGAPGAVSYVNGLRAVNLRRRSDGDLGMTTSTPFSMGFMGHRNKTYGPDVLDTNPDRFAATYLGRREVDGMVLSGARFEKKETHEVFEHWFDPAHGYLPVRAYGTDIAKRVTTYRIMSFRECSRGRYYPERTLSTVRMPDGTIEVREMLVLEFEADKKPAPEDFAIKVPAKTQVVWIHNRKHYYFKQDETIYAKDMPAFFEMSERASTIPLTDTAVPVSRSFWDWKAWLALAIAGVLIIGGGLTIVRRRIHRTFG